MRHFFYCCAILMFTCLVAHAATPAVALKLMPAHAISLRWQKLPTDANNAVWLHIYCVPKGRDPQLKNMGVDKSGPITREDIGRGPSLAPSPFWLDVFADANANRRLNSVKFGEGQDVQDIVLRWLEPKARRGPVVLLKFGYTHWYEWQTFTFAQGWAKPAHAQTFLYGGEGDIYSWFYFDRTDAQGHLIVAEEEGLENDKERTNIYRWNGREWDDKTMKYFIVGASVKTKSAADEIMRKRGYGEVLHSNDYPKLRPGYWIWVAGRLRTKAETDDFIAHVDNEGAPLSVRLAR